jgi:excisionase family DNA binding protein
MKDYHIVIFYSEEDGCYIADIPDLEMCSASGASPEEALREVLVARDLWLQTAQEEGVALPVPTYQPELYQRRARQPRMVLTTREAAVMLGVQPSRIRHMILSGQLRAEKDGRNWWILRSDLEKAKDRPGVGYPKGRPRARSAPAFQSD